MPSYVVFLPSPHSTFVENSVSQAATSSSINPPDGGALLFASSDFLLVHNCVFARNNATGFGGAVAQSLCGMATGSSTTVSNNTFVSNLAVLSGGAVMSQNSKTTVLTDNSFMYNKASRSAKSTSKLDSNGGAVCFDGSSGSGGTIANNTFQSNFARFDGGAVAVSGGYSGALIANNTFYGNNAIAAGGAVAVLSKASRVTLKHNYLGFNKAVRYGGAMVVEDSSYVSIVDCDFVANDVTGTDSGQGGALSASWTLVMTVAGSSFQNNSAGEWVCWE